MMKYILLRVRWILSIKMCFVCGDLLMAIWRTMVCGVHDRLADGVLCGNQPNSAGQVPSKIGNVVVLGDIVASDTASPFVLIFVALFYYLQHLMLLNCLFG